MKNEILKEKVSGLKRRTSKRYGILVFFLIIPLISSCYQTARNRVVAQPVPAGTSVNQNIAAITQVYFYPVKGQSTEQQSRDHYECYDWAMGQTGFDPSLSSIVPVQRVRVVPMPPPGHDTVVMSIAGAVLGALIAGPRHAAGGALIGAAGGAAAGAASDISRQQSTRQLEEAYDRSNEARDMQKEQKALNFRRAMSACLEGRGYSIK